MPPMPTEPPECIPIKFNRSLAELDPPADEDERTGLV
jgi:hypothetical protein